MKISIAMATYNGAKYLQEQLDSFVAQRRQPDELIVTDDGSSDDTLNIVRQFTKTAPFEVRVFQNKSNLGYARNFSRAMSQCSGDLIFLSDQDDVWLPPKIEHIIKLADSHHDMQLFMNNAELTYDDGTPTGLTKQGQTLSLGLAESQFTTGCCMAVRRPLLEIALPVPTPEFVHDTWLNRLALSLGVRMSVPMVMQYYRRHGENTSEWIASRTTRQTRFDLLRAYRGRDPRPYAEKRLKQLSKLEDRLASGGARLHKPKYFVKRVEDAITEISRERHVVESRLQLLQEPRWRRVRPMAAFYFKGQYRYFSGWRSFLKDLLYSR